MHTEHKVALEPLDLEGARLQIQKWKDCLLSLAHLKISLLCQIFILATFASCLANKNLGLNPHF